MAFFIPLIAAGSLVSTVAATAAITLAVAHPFLVAAVAATFISSVLKKSDASSASTGNSSASPTYKFGALQTQANNQLCIPIIYGKVKAAGNIIWQTDPTKTTINRIVCYADGQINSFSDVRFNDYSISTVTSKSALSGCNYTAYNGTSTQLIDSRVTGTTQQAKATLVGGLKSTAYLALTAKASSSLSGSFTTTAIIEGSLVKVYSNETTYTTAYSNNPAWCILDFLTRYNGCAIAPTDIDIQSFIDAAAYCDEIITSSCNGTVSTTAGSKTVTGTNTTFLKDYAVGDTFICNSVSKVVSSVASDAVMYLTTTFPSTLSNKTHTQQQKRFTINLILDERKTRLDWLTDMCSTCQSSILYQQGKIYLDIQKPKTVMQVFDEDNILTGTEVISFTPRENRFDIVRVKYPSPNDQYAIVYASSEYPTFLGEQPVVKEIEVYGVTNFRQASRLSWYFLNQSRTCLETMTLTTNKTGLDRTIGDLIAVTSTFTGYIEKKYQIISMSEPQSGQIEISALEYNENLFNDTQGTVAPSVNYVALSDAFGIPDDVSYFNVSLNYNILQFAWTEIDGVNISYEIREGSSWNIGTVVATGVTGSNFSCPISSTGTHYYWIKAINNTNNLNYYSENATESVLIVTDIPNANIVVSTNILTADGSFTNCYMYNNKLKMNNADAILWTDDEVFSSSGDRYYADDANFWGTGDYSATATFVSKVFDIGNILRSYVTLTYDFYSTVPEQVANAEWCYSEDNITWSDWLYIGQNQGQGAYDFRFYQVRMTISNPFQGLTYIGNPVFQVDVPDRLLHYSGLAITNAVSGISVTFDRDFTVVPSVTATISDGTVGKVSLTRSKSGFNIKVYNNSDVAIIAIVDAIIKGY